MNRVNVRLCLLLLDPLGNCRHPGPVSSQLQTDRQTVETGRQVRQTSGQMRQTGGTGQTDRTDRQVLDLERVYLRCVQAPAAQRLLGGVGSDIEQEVMSPRGGEVHGNPGVHCAGTQVPQLGSDIISNLISV